MTIIRDGDAPRFGEEGVSVTGLASPSRGCATVSAWRVVLAPGAGSPEHTLTSDEAFVALRGTARVTLDGAEHDVGRRLPRRRARARVHDPQRRAGAVRGGVLHGRGRAGDRRPRGRVRAA